MILEYRWCTLRLINRGKLDVLLFFRSLNPKFYVSYRLGIFVDPRLIARAKVFLQTCNLLGDGIQKALVLTQSRFALPGIGGSRVTEQFFEDGTRIPLHRQRLCRASPRNRVRVRAAEDSRAGAGVSRLIH